MDDDVSFEPYWPDIDDRCADPIVKDPSEMTRSECVRCLTDIGFCNFVGASLAELRGFVHRERKGERR